MGRQERNRKREEDISGRERENRRRRRKIRRRGMRVLLWCLVICIVCLVAYAGNAAFHVLLNGSFTEEVRNQEDAGGDSSVSENVADSLAEGDISASEEGEYTERESREIAEGETTEGWTTEGEATEGETTGGETTEGETTEEDTAEDEIVEDSATDGSASDEDRVKVKGIYVTGPKAGSDSFQDLLALVDETELNTMVIDVKNDSGEITFRVGDDYPELQGAVRAYISDIQTFMETLKEHGIYTIARIVCFKDPALASKAPELALTSADGMAIVDSNDQSAWVNPCSEEVWDYLVQVGKLAASVGFDEVQFDYVRFPTGTAAEQADYGIEMGEDTKTEVITAFLSYAVEELHEVGIRVTADVFGTVITSEVDTKNLGQDYAALGSLLDVISPMVYPSHYSAGAFGLSVPDAQPYETILAAMTASAETLAGVDESERATVRPWLQAFTATWVRGHISYGGDQIRAQIQAVYDAGYEEWILWNASNKYTADGLLAE